LKVLEIEIAVKRIENDLSLCQDCSREKESVAENVFKIDKENFLLKLKVTAQEFDEDKPTKTSL
jgi:hypothetical protein